MHFFFLSVRNEIVALQVDEVQLGVAFNSQKRLSVHIHLLAILYDSWQEPLKVGFVLLHGLQVEKTVLFSIDFGSEKGPEIEYLDLEVCFVALLDRLWEIHDINRLFVGNELKVLLSKQLFDVEQLNLLCVPVQLLQTVGHFPKQSVFAVLAEPPNVVLCDCIQQLDVQSQVLVLQFEDGSVCLWNFSG